MLASFWFLPTVKNKQTNKKQGPVIQQAGLKNKNKQKQTHLIVATGDSFGGGTGRPPTVRCGVLLSTPPPWVRLCSGVTDGGLLLSSEAGVFPLPLHCCVRDFTSSPKFSIPTLSSSSFWMDLQQPNTRVLSPKRQLVFFFLLKTCTCRPTAWLELQRKTQILM